MYQKIILGLVLFFVQLSSVKAAVEVSELNPIERLTVVSKQFKQPLEYNVTLPQSYYQNDSAKKYFVVFDLHPRSQPMLTGMHDWLSHNGEWPWLESIVVTPVGYNAEFAKLFERLVDNPDNHAILDYFEQDLLKALDSKYRTNGFRIYSGFMSNGAFGLYTLLNRPDLFNGYILSSPTIAGDFGAIMSQAKDKLKKLDEKMRFLYLSTGNHRYEQGQLKSFDELETILQSAAPATLDWHVVRNNKNNYMSQPVVSMINAIELMFDDMHSDLSADSDISKQGSQAIIDYYAMLSEKKYGFDVSAQGSLGALAKSLLASEPEQALKIYHQTITLYPDSSYAFSSLAKAYQHTGKLDKAIKYQTQAVLKSKTLNLWHQRKQQEYLDLLTAKASTR